ncbi:MAG: DegQ family serine endoprotease [Planctomycetota bacterium]|nr:MAG: DegQ family serine endoprotease [Planctomycetota bacterium]REJ96185.1 MAG: DegQ family serine endoprotease [Planctomycetota bacterium]
MIRNTRPFRVLLVLFLIGAFSAAAVFYYPNALSQLTYAVERGKAEVSKEQLQTASDLSTAFKHVAKALRPSVVSVSSVKRLQATQPQIHRFGQPHAPDELRRFFGDDFFDRFFFDLPTPPRGFEQRGMGTGVIVSEDGYIVTNNHVVDNADEVTVTLSDKRQFRAEIIGTDKPTDLAVLKIDANGLAAATLGNSSALEVGDWVLAIGSPFGLDQTVTAGIVSATGRANVGIADYEDFIQTDAAINPGNSGGPLVNLRGEVVGINTAIASRTGGNLGVGFAIPSDMAKSVLDNLIEHGHVERGYLGAMIQDLNEDLAESFGYEDKQGVLIGDVLDDGPAAKAGLKGGDIVIELNGQRVESANELRNAVAATKAGTEVDLRIFRDGKQQNVRVEIGQIESSAIVAGRSGSVNNDLGIKVQTLTPEMARKHGIDDDEQGVVVTEVEPGSTAATMGIQPGDVIVSIGGNEVNNLTDFRNALQEQDVEKGVRMQIMRDGVRRFVFIKIRR